MPGQMLVVHVWWTEGSAARQETYGPWAAAEDLSHMEQITAFLKDWKAATGCEWHEVTLAVVIDPKRLPERLPAEFIPVPEGWTPEQIADFRERWNAGHVPPR